MRHKALGKMRNKLWEASMNDDSIIIYTCCTAHTDMQCKLSLEDKNGVRKRTTQNPV